MKFTNARARRRVFDARRCLKEVNAALEYQRRLDKEDDAADDEYETITLTRPIYMNEDLSGARLKLAFEARQLKRAGKIMDTWVIDGKIKIKDSRNVITTAGSLKDLVKFGYMPQSPQTNNGQINPGAAAAGNGRG